MHSLEKYLIDNPGSVKAIEESINRRESMNTLKAGGWSSSTAQSIKEKRAALARYKAGHTRN